MIKGFIFFVYFLIFLGASLPVHGNILPFLFHYNSVVMGEVVHIS